MEQILSFFKIGTSFASACTHYILIMKVNELKKDLNTMKDHSLELAFEFVRTASLCENPSNLPFLLHSAYENFTSSTLYYRESTDKLFNLFVKKFFSKLKWAKALSLDDFDLSYFDEEDLNIIRKECQKLELSFIGKSMCEYYLNEYSLCIKSLDSTIGIYYPLFLRLCKRYIDDGFLDDLYERQYASPLLKKHKEFCESTLAMFYSGYFGLYISLNEKAGDYFKAILEIALDNGIENDFINKLPNRKAMTNLLVMAAVKSSRNGAIGQIAIDQLIDVIGIQQEELIPMLNNTKNQNIISILYG